LRGAGAGEVVALCFARTMRRRPGQVAHDPAAT
jgi:hypothetical protein